MPESPEKQAIELVAPRKFHQIFTIPATTEHEQLKLTYAICGKEDGEDTPTILFSGGMFGSRWQAPFQNWLAEKEEVRVIFIDRPGFGGSTIIPIHQRISVYVEAVSALLKQLNIKQVSIASHSAGTIFALNLLATLPQILSPTNPSVTLCSPWVHQSQSGAAFLTAAAMLPNGLLNHWSSLTGFMINHAAPGFASSSGALSAISSVFQLGGKKEMVEQKRRDNEERCMSGYGIGLDVKKELDTLVMKYAFTEESSGGNDEARLCMKSIPGTDWGALQDYPSYIAALKDTWEKKFDADGIKLKIRVLLAEEDIMIGVKGRDHIEECWSREACGRGIDVECVIIEETDHDSILDPSKGAIAEIYSALKELRPAFTEPLDPSLA